jgi:VanZ family protein
MAWAERAVASRVSNRMRDLRYSQLWLVVGWLLVAAVVWFSLVPRAPAFMQYTSDKLMHALAYFVLMGWFVQIYRAPRLLGVIAVGLVVLGITLELLQGLLATRMADVTDVFSDVVGVAVGAGLAWTSLAHSLQRIEHWLGGEE